MNRKPAYKEQRSAPASHKFNPDHYMKSPKEDSHIKQLMNNEIEELKDTVRYLEQQLVNKKKEQEDYIKEIYEAKASAKDHEGNYIKEKAVAQNHLQKFDNLKLKMNEHHVAQNEVSINFKGF